MSGSRGLRKAAKYDWKQTNLANFGSDIDKKVKKESAKTEPAWQGAGRAPGLQIWRIEQFKVKDVPKEDYGEFFSGDSYIILNTYKDKDSDELHYDVYFWIGKYSSTDEYGTAAYKTVELDTFLDDKPVQHREVQGHESDLFKSYFPKGMVIMEGGVNSGFVRVADKAEYIPRLTLVSRDKNKKVVLKEVPRRLPLNSDDVYVLDAGDILYQWNGNKSSPFERNKASDFICQIKSKRGEVSSVVLEEDSTSDSHPFFGYLNEDPDDDDDSDNEDPTADNKLYRVNTDTRDYELVKEGGVTQDDFKSDDVFIFDNGQAVFVWIGANASPDEKKNGLPLAHNYISSTGQPWRPLVVLREGTKCETFAAALRG
ncbi:gelsolin-like protein 2 isoform X2 [Pomacea canaliculata]|uniref:gelsolin-like protein 2 isoform X2 n=1 Tax=Pomacea canaliculata TaxID=400727 RepID=UPI000D72C192|nr:gelsolin-like protein 2 isoform X2 [Pomacea canaliculata]